MDEQNPLRKLGLQRPAAWCALAVLASCQSYESRPLNSAVHRDAWHSREVTEGSLTSLLERLGERDGHDIEFDVHDGLTLEEAQLVAFVFNTDLRLGRLRALGAASLSEVAGIWADPRFSLSVLRVNENVPDRWVINPSLTFQLPLSGHRAADESVKLAGSRAAAQYLEETRWRVNHEVGQAWFEWSAAKLEVEVTEQYIDSMNSLVQTTSQLAESGELPRTEASLFLVEQAQRANQLQRMRGEVEAKEQRLRTHLGLAPEAAVEFVASMAGEETLGDSARDATEIGQCNPTLAHLRLKYEVTEETLRREILKQYPNLTIGPQYEGDEGQSRIGFVGGFPIPIWNANRQAIEKARLAREVARAAYETKYETLVGEHAVESARARALRAQRADTENVLAPLVERQLEDALRLMQLGEGSSLVLLESLSRAYQVKLDLIEARKAEAQVASTLEHLIGPPIADPSTVDTDESR